MTTTQTSTLKHMAIAGITGELAFEAYAWALSPALFGASLQPANLVVGLTKAATGLTLPYGAAFAIHALIGSLGFAAMVWLVRRVGGLGHVVAGALAGLILWFVAQGLLAPLMGRSFMMGFGAYTQSSFIGHVGMTLIIGLVWKWLDTRHPTAAHPA